MPKLLLLCWLSVCALPLGVRAEESFAQRLSLRYTAGASLMLSNDQRGWLGYEAPGLLSDVQLGLRFSPLLAAQIGVAGGIFFSPVANGAVLAPLLGGTLHWGPAGLPTYVSLNIGAAITGDLLRPFARAVLGAEWALTSQFNLGPALGLDLVTQSDGMFYSTDAIYAWAGVGLSFRASRSAPVRRRIVEKPEPPPPPASEPEPELEPEPLQVHEPLPPPSAAIAALLDDAVQVSRTELLAPVLFDYDSATLQPNGIAMLHEVARHLNLERKDIQLLAVIAYADARGSPEYNLTLSQRRAEQVRQWLVEHGVDRARLTVEAHGAGEPVEVGDDETNHQQNRRVVFRVLRTEVRP
jgi:outer membrane protein OmpA-like peptidoglycan-associated protein